MECWKSRKEHIGNFNLKGEFWDGFSENGQILARINRDDVSGRERGTDRTIVWRSLAKDVVEKVQGVNCYGETPGQ